MISFETDSNEFIITVKEKEKLLKKAKVSSLKSTGYFIRGEMRKEISTFKFKQKQPPVFKGFSGNRKSSSGINPWARSNREKPFSFLKDVVRYGLKNENNLIIFYSGSRAKSAKPKSEKQLLEIIERVQKGRNYAVNNKMRGMMGLARRVNRNVIIVPRKETKIIKVEARPFVSPTYRKIKNTALSFYEKRYFEKIIK